MTRIEPGLKGVVVRPSNQITQTKTGFRQEAEIVMPKETYEQYRQGYRCIKCHSVQSQPFPRVCEAKWKDGGGCGFPMADQQMHHLEVEFTGEVDLWPEDREDWVQEERERENWQRKTGIWLPSKE